MALHLNLLHEHIAEKRQRQRDPLKLGMFALLAVGTLMALFYMWRGYQTLEVKGRLGTVRAEWAKVEPKMVAAQKRSAELNAIIGTTRVLDEMIEGRFFWAPFLARISRCVAPNAQFTSMDGTVREDNKFVGVSMDGMAAGREPRAAAEELRQLLIEQLGQSYTDVKAEFKTLEDLDTIVKIGGANMSMARYTLIASFNPASSQPSKTPATPAPRQKK